MKQKQLKTLDYIRPTNHKLNVVFRDELKEEALKWIEEINKQREEIKEYFENKHGCDERYIEIDKYFIEMSQDVNTDNKHFLYDNNVDDLIRWIKHFFNISEKDLK